MEEQDGFWTQQEIDQAIAEAVMLGSMRLVRDTATQQEVVQLTTKGMVQMVLLCLTHLIDTADQECRDFTRQETQEALEAIRVVQRTLQEEEEQNQRDEGKTV